MYKVMLYFGRAADHISKKKKKYKKQKQEKKILYVVEPKEQMTTKGLWNVGSLGS